SPRDLLKRAVAGSEDVPGAIARAEDGEVGLAVAIEVGGDGHVTGCSPLDLLKRVVAGAEDVPLAGARAEDGQVGLAVPVVVGGHEDIPARHTAPGGLGDLATGQKRPPLSGRLPLDSDGGRERSGADYVRIG